MTIDTDLLVEVLQEINEVKNERASSQCLVEINTISVINTIILINNQVKPLNYD